MYKEDSSSDNGLKELEKQEGEDEEEEGDGKDWNEDWDNVDPVIKIENPPLLGGQIDPVITNQKLTDPKLVWSFD